MKRLMLKRGNIIDTIVESDTGNLVRWSDVECAVSSHGNLLAALIRIKEVGCSCDGMRTNGFHQDSDCPAEIARRAIENTPWSPDRAAWVCGQCGKDNYAGSDQRLACIWCGQVALNIYPK